VSGELDKGVLGRLDRAIELVRRQPAAELARAAWPGAGLSLLAMAVYYAERVEGVRSLRMLFALGFALLYVARAVGLARWAGRRVDELLVPYRVPAVHGSWQSIARAAVWVALDLWFWLWLVVLAIHLDALLVPLVLPLFAVRGALFPAWLACADGAPDAGGFAVLRRAVEQADGQRVQGILLELLLLIGALGVGINLLALGGGIISIGQEMLGLDLSFVNAFLSYKNHFALLFVLALSLTVFEPLRAALSAVLYTDALLTREGISVRSLVVRATEARSRGRAAALGVLALLCTSPLRAQDESGELPVESNTEGAELVLAPEAAEELVPEEPCEGACLRARESDARVRDRAASILAAPAFEEFPEEDWSVDAEGKDIVTRWLEKLFEWLLQQKEQEQARSQDGILSDVNLPPAAFFIALAVVIAAVGIFWLARRGPAAEHLTTAPASDDPLARPAEAHLDDALALASRDLRAALRSLYLATLVGLERRSMLHLAPERTNGQYLRELPQGDDRQMFGAFTRIFDAVHYGARTPSHEDFATCRSLAERLIAGNQLR
jgi:hypothetical protein